MHTPQIKKDRCSCGEFENVHTEQPWHEMPLNMSSLVVLARVAQNYLDPRKKNPGKCRGGVAAPCMPVGP